jgi:hypothetical protein
MPIYQILGALSLTVSLLAWVLMNASEIKPKGGEIQGLEEGL